jgi:hypothetical protein
MPLPIVKPEVYCGLAASPSDLDGLIARITPSNPEVLKLIRALRERHGLPGVASALSLYRPLEAQADSDDLE